MNVRVPKGFVGTKFCAKSLFVGIAMLNHRYVHQVAGPTHSGGNSLAVVCDHCRLVSSLAEVSSGARIGAIAELN